MPSPPPAEAHQSLLIPTNAHPPHQRPLSARLHIWWAGISLPRRAHPLGRRPNPSPPNLKPPHLRTAQSAAGHQYQRPQGPHSYSAAPKWAAGRPLAGRRGLTLVRRQAGSIRLHIWWARTCQHPMHRRQQKQTPAHQTCSPTTETIQLRAAQGGGEAKPGGATGQSRDQRQGIARAQCLHGHVVVGHEGRNPGEHVFH